MGHKWDKFRLLMWKNWLLQYRRPLQTLIEIQAPVLFCCLLVIMRSLVDPREFPDKIYHPFAPLPMPILQLSKNLSQHDHLSILRKFVMLYSPRNNTEIDMCMDKLKTIFKEVKGYENSQKMEDSYLGSTVNETFAGIEFDDELRGKTEIPERAQVTLRFPGKLRGLASFMMPFDDDDGGNDKISQILFSHKHWKTNLIYPMFQASGPRDMNRSTGGSPSYYAEGFLALQVVATYILATRKFPLEKNVTPTSIVKIFMKYKKIPMLRMQRFPHSKWINDPLLPGLRNFIGVLTVLSLVYTCISTVKVITMEKEKQLKEAMKIMGLPNWLHWTAWFIKTFIFLLISAVLIIILFKVSWYSSSTYSLFTFADPSVMLVFFVCYLVATITYCFAITVFFSKANTAATVAGILWFLAYAPYLFLQEKYDQISLSTKLFASLGSNTAMAFGYQIMLTMEGTEEGSQWHNLWQPTSQDDNLSLGLILVMLIVDALIYFLIMIYVEAVFPGEFGVPQPPHFFVTKSYWFGTSAKTIKIDNIIVIDTPQNNDTEFFERDPDDLKCGIQIKNLRKVFHKKLAVRNLSVNLYDNQITVLLGHNGAGKTTTLSMLMGMFPPTSGTAIISGFDIRHNMDNIRMSLGICPQHNILFDDLTVKEHLYFFSKLKGLSKIDIDIEIDNYINLLELTDKSNSKSSTLSGGMKRKLCVGMALCGRSKIVMLDEPSAGMDPGARRTLWNILQQEKLGRTILLTTHFMDEADLLADRIAILAGGELQCCGTSFFLKKKYGAGYRLILDKAKSCESKTVTELLKKHIGDIEVYGDVGSELTYVLNENDAEKFEEMLDDLEMNLEELGVMGYGISLATLEEVFMKVGADRGQEEAYNAVDLLAKPSRTPPISKKVVTKTLSPPKINRQQSETKNAALLTGCALIRNQFLAMLMKRSLSMVRSWVLLFVQNLIPLSFLVIAIIAIRARKSTGDLPKLDLSLDTYQRPVTLIETDGDNDMYLEFYKDALGKRKLEVVDNITETMLNLTARDPSLVRLRYIVGVSIEGGLLTSITAWFNNNPYHSPPLALAFALNIPYKQILGRSHTITFSSKPFPYTADTKVQQLLSESNMGFQLAFNISFGMAFVSSFYIIFYVKERVCKSKHLQFISGINFSIFWITSYICDLMHFVITILVVLSTILTFQEDGFKTASDLGRLFLLLLCFGFGMIPIHYIASYFFDVPATGFIRMTLFSVFMGVFAFFIVFMLKTPGLDLEYVADTLHWIFLLVPHYSLASGIKDLYMSFGTNKMCKILVRNCAINLKMTEDECWDFACFSSKNTSEVLSKYCCSREPDYYRWESPGIGRNLIYTFTVGISLFLLLLLIESKIFSKLSCRLRSKQKAPKPGGEDSDVLIEKSTIHDMPLEKLLEENTLVLKDVTKYYGKFLAVNGICLAAKQFNCFGLLGINGAGKTTTFKILTGDVKISWGEAWVMGRSIRTEFAEVQKLIGYCPQFDALLDNLTAKETLIMFALVRGVSLKECTNLAAKLAKNFDFSRHLKKKVKELSGGNKRKLSTAIALIGDPPVIYLDEPTTGMDPATKRHLWDAICTVRDSGKCVVLTSHSMEECEALCTRLAIMVNGRFRCIGSTQHLKNKFGEGYILSVKVKKSSIEGDSGRDVATVEAFVKMNFPTAVQREKHQELLTYYVEDKKVSLAKMFGILERGKKEINIEDYSLGQSSLEQVFLGFAQHQV